MSTRGWTTRAGSCRSDLWGPDVRILHTSDWHVGRTIRGRSRDDEHIGVLKEMLDVVEDERIDLVLVAGDQFDTASPSSKHDRMVYRALLGFADRGAKVVVVAGNHDNAARLAAVAPLLERGGDIHVAAQPTPREDGGTVRVDTGAGEARIALLPWVSQRGIVKAVDLLEGDQREHATKYIDRVRLILDDLCADFGDGDAVDIVLAHLTVAGASGRARDGGGVRMHHVFDYLLPPQQFPDTAHYVALGHLHQPHELPGPTKIRYCGSPIALDFGEVDTDRGFTVVTVDDPGSPAVPEHRPLDAGYRLVTVRGDLDQVGAQAAEIGEQAYLRVVVEETPRPGLFDEVREVVPTAVDVRVADPDRPEPEADIDLDRIEGVADDPTELLSVYLDEEPPDEADPESLVELFRELHEDRVAAGAGAEDGAGDGEA